MLTIKYTNWYRAAVLKGSTSFWWTTVRMPLPDLPSLDSCQTISCHILSRWVRKTVYLCVSLSVSFGLSLSLYISLCMWVLSSFFRPLTLSYSSLSRSVPPCLFFSLSMKIKMYFHNSMYLQFRPLNVHWMPCRWVERIGTQGIQFLNTKNNYCEINPWLSLYFVHI